ncbi:MAG: hypothetical protein PHX72_01105 [Candidatus Shapirobacteria bacterium]|nr:hypothetical protein [Candidatus Shapirobacteria bacterium]
MLPKRSFQQKKRPSSGQQNLGDFVQEEVKKITQEVTDQVGVSSQSHDSLGQLLPPKPDDTNSDKASFTNGEEDKGENKKQRLEEVRVRLSRLQQEENLAIRAIDQERQERAKKRDPIIEGVDNEDSPQKNILPPPHTTSKPKRGLPLPGTGQPEKRQRR